MKNAIFEAKNRKKLHKKRDFCKFSVHPVAILMWGWLCFVFGFGVAVAYFFAILFHELCHVFVAKRLGYVVSKFSISPYGFSLSLDEKNLDFRDEFWIAIAGPAANFLTALVCVAIWWFFPETYFFTAEFVRISIVIALFNLLPCHPLDGGRVFVSIATFFVSPKTAKRISNLFNLMLGCFFFVLFVLSIFSNFNPSLLLFAVFLFCGSLEIAEGTKFEKFNFFAKKTRNFSRADVIFVNLDVSLGEILKKVCVSKSHVFCVTLNSGKTILLSEEAIKKLVCKFEIDTKLCEIFEK